MMYLEVAGGLILLLFGGEALVRGAIHMAERLGVSKLIIGLTIVALGTSAPELVVSVEAALNGVPDIAVGNVVGSNIANVLLVLGLPALIYPVACDCDGPVRRNSVFMVAASLLFIGLGWNGVYEFWHGLILVLLLATFLLLSYRYARKYGDTTAVALTEELEADTPKSKFGSIAYIVVGIAALPIGSTLLINGAVSVAAAAGLSQAVVGLTLVALGTSLPELATSVIAALHKEDDVAIGNVVGSNMFNILGIMGVTALITPVSVADKILHFDMWVMLLAAVLLLALTLRKMIIGRLIGAFCFLGYASYVTAQIHGWSGVVHTSAM